MANYDSFTYPISDFYQWHNREELNISPKYQRRSVWTQKAKSYFLDTIIRKMPMPKIFMRHEIDIVTKKTTREVIDGQQRIKTILSYIDNGITIMKVHNREFGGLYFSELPEEKQRDFLEYKISVDYLISATETEILDMFARINTYTVTLNKQELLNSKYFGAFKQCVYSLGYEFKSFWVNNNIITEKGISRMLEAEFSSELIIFLIAGIQDKKNIESFYKKHDDNFPNEDSIKERFRRNIDIISTILGDNLSDSYYSTRPLFYTLFGVLDDLVQQKKIKEKYYPKICNALLDIDAILNEKPDNINQKYFKFYDASTKHVTDLSARKIRFDFISKYILNVI